MIEMIRIELNKNWKMNRIGEAMQIDASVPGSAYGDLLAAGLMEDPFWKDNEDKALKLMDDDYEYFTCFSCPPELLEKEKVILHFDGLDTIADIY